MHGSDAATPGDAHAWWKLDSFIDCNVNSAAVLGRMDAINVGNEHLRSHHVCVDGTC